MENPVQDFEFLDLSDINDNDRHQLQTVLYSRDPSCKYPELPWCSSVGYLAQQIEPPHPPLNWVVHQTYEETGSVVDDAENEASGHDIAEEEEQEEPAAEGLISEQDSNVNTNMYPAQEIPVNNMPMNPPNPNMPMNQNHNNMPMGGDGGTGNTTPIPTVYPGPFSNVYVNNMTANVSVHGYMGSAPPPPHPFHPGPPPHHGPIPHGHVPPPHMAFVSQPAGSAPIHNENQHTNNHSVNRKRNTKSGGRRLEQQQATPNQPPSSQHQQHQVEMHPSMGGHPPPMQPYPAYQHQNPYYAPPMYFSHNGLPPPNGPGGGSLYLQQSPQVPMYHPSHSHPHAIYQQPPNYGPPHPGSNVPPHQVYTGPQGGHHMPPQPHMPPHHHMPPPVPNQPPPPHGVKPHHSHEIQHQTMDEASHQQQKQQPPPPLHHSQHMPPPQQQQISSQYINNKHSQQQQHQSTGPIEQQQSQIQVEDEYEDEEEQANQYEENVNEEECIEETNTNEHYVQGQEQEGEEEGIEDQEESHSDIQFLQQETNEEETEDLEDADKQLDELELEDKEVHNSSNTESSQNISSLSSASYKNDDPILSPQNTTPVQQTETAAPSSGGSKTWASLFNSKNNTLSSSSSMPPTTKPCARVEPTPQTPPMKYTNKMSPIPSAPITESNQQQQQSVPYRGGNQKYSYNNNYYNNNKMGFDDVGLQHIAKILSDPMLDHKGISLQPRGLINRSNYCYINATLQALIACPPFYNLLRTINKNFSSKYQRNRNNSETQMPIFNAMLQLASEFQYLQLSPGTSSQYRRDQEIKTGTPFEPTYVYQILSTIKSDSSFSIEGRQEDAEEFLTCLLNGLNDEMLELFKSQSSKEKSQQSAVNGKGHSPNAKNGISNGDLNGDVHAENADDDGDWKEVTKESKNKGSIVRRHTSVADKTPVSEIFRGHLRTRVTRVSDSTTTENIQPFFTLALDIEKASSVKEAFDQLVSREGLEGVTSTKTNQETEAYQTVTIEELPFVLLLHLKCFDYKLQSCHKIQKAIEFPVTFSLEPKWLSSNKNKKGPMPGGLKNKQYKLFAVVYHDGKEATKGHYITDVFHVGYSGWIRYDDSNVRFVTESEVLHPKPPRVPYILYYRRADTIVSKNNSNGPSS